MKDINGREIKKGDLAIVVGFNHGHWDTKKKNDDPLVLEEIGSFAEIMEVRQWDTYLRALLSCNYAPSFGQKTINIYWTFDGKDLEVIEPGYFL